MFKSIVKFIFLIWELLYLPLLLILCFIARFFKKPIDIGLGPEPLINNFYHKKALKLFGYSAETFVKKVYFIINKFDFNFSSGIKLLDLILFRVIFIDFLFSIFRYKSLYIYFTGGPLSQSYFLWQFEPYFLKLANLKVVVMPYGSDVQTLDQTPNLYFRHAYTVDYPSQRFIQSLVKRKRDLWIKNADCIVAGCDWVDYLYYWDVLLVSHFSIDVNYLYESLTKNKYTEDLKNQNDKDFVILHAPNHKYLKGTSFVNKAILELKQEGFSIDYRLIEGKTNDEIISLIDSADLIIDQLVVGWYAMFAIEAMALKKPVICFLREDLLNLYRFAGLIKKDEPPLINSHPLDLKDTLRKCLTNQIDLKNFGDRGFEYVEKIHSIRSIGEKFDSINVNIGLKADS